MYRMHEKYWEYNTGLQLLAWYLDADDTSKLVERSPVEGDATLLKDAAMRYLKVAIGEST